MSKYIDLDKAITIFDTHGRKLTTTVFQILDRNGAVYETANVVVQKHGQWKDSNYNLVWNADGVYKAAYQCSNCGACSPIVGYYCYNCGARMDGE